MAKPRTYFVSRHALRYIQIPLYHSFWLIVIVLIHAKNSFYAFIRPYQETETKRENHFVLPKGHAVSDYKVVEQKRQSKMSNRARLLTKPHWL